MARPFIIAASLSLGWMLSPDVLVRLGNGIAESRTLFLAALGLATLLSALAVSLIRHPALRRNGRCSQEGLLVQGIGRLAAMTLILASRISLLLLLSTGLLVTAGFSFNEVFLYWFPNFGFAFLLLGMITLLHLAGERLATAAQPYFVITALLCLFVLCLAGLGGPASSKPISVDIGLTFDSPVLAGALLLFLGIDYITPGDGRDSRLPALAALFCCLLFFLIWSMVSLQYVPADRLASSTMPHMLAAREIMGEPGRILMGVAVICGSCAAVNAFFHLAAGALAGLSSRDMLPGHPPGRLRRHRFILLFALLIGALMMGGLAGYDKLETYIEASLLLWLLVLGMQCLAAGRILHLLGNAQAWQGYSLGAVYAILALFLAVTNEHSADIIRFTLLVLAASTGICAFWLWKKPAVEVLKPQSETTGGK